MRGDFRSPKNALWLAAPADSVMSATKGKEASILEDPNAVRHMDALFDVLRKPAERKPRGGSATAAAELGPGADMDFLLDALFAVVQTDPAAGDGGGGRAVKITAKSWRERGLPASFFDAGGSTTEHQSVEGEESPHSDAEDEVASPSPVPSPESSSHTHTPNSVATEQHASLTTVPVVLVANTDSTDSLTFYIDKHLQCRVNMEPALERRRRLARGRVQKYRSIKRHRKQRKTDNVLPETACS